MSTSIIKQRRKKQGMTQQELADELGVSRTVLLAIENGDRDLKLSEVEGLSRVLGLSMEELRGEKAPDYEKYLEMIRVYLRKVKAGPGDGRVPKTKLAKLLYLADFSWYYDNLESMSAMPYRKIKYGPVPDQYFRAIDELEDDGIITVDKKDHHDGTTHLISLTDIGEKITNNQLSDEEVDRISEIEDKWHSKNSKEIYTFTHNQLPYSLAFEGDMVSYALIGQEDPDNIY